MVIQSDIYCSMMMRNSEMKFPFKLPVGYFRVVGGFNGLLCVADDYFTDKPQIIIWNPSTRKSITLPMAPKTKRPHMCVYGFGSHPATHEYEVIRIQYEYEMEEFELKLPPKVEIYTQGTISCRGISSAAPSYHIFNYIWSLALVDGIVHWVAFEPCAWLGGGVRNLILLFNMASESFSEFKLPPTLADQPPPSLSIKTFGQSRAVLCSGQRDSDGCCIWVMKEYGVAESWTKLFSSNLLGMPNKTLGFRKNGEVLLASDNSLASYAPGTNTLATTGIKGSLRAFYVDPFMQTLVSV
ncbi:hypothetical protein RHMOL_Rhmol04G0092400 [Rhododendron molle]|uniref:Uncharacterized protein n=1 Tax=Rhododendron molle TaxID=49168 RepID=A0ACC0NYG6_RHOML|nr:hypothetical protein RHMOL_Rhmol04G0092400 [Rhododendron molle]